MRVGELLMGEGLLTGEQLAAALQLQRRSGSRIGTCLVDLGFVDIDTLARALSGQQRVPAVLTKHLAAIDSSIIKLFPARVAAELQAIPLGYTQTKPARLVVALRDPLTTSLEEIAFMAGTRIDPGIAPELSIRRCLEKYYGVKSDRFIDVDVGAIYSHSSMPPAAGESPVPPAPPPAQAAPASARPAEVRGPATLSVPPPPRLSLPPPFDPPAYDPPLPPSPEPAADAPDAPDDGWDDMLANAPLPEPRALTAPPGALHAVIDLDQAVLALRAATSRDEVGDALTDFMRSEYGCGLVLIVKAGTALGWKGFAPDAEPDLLESIAVPLGVPSMLTEAHDRRLTFRGAPPEEGKAFQTRLWKLLRCEAPAEVIVAPVVLGNRVINLLYAHAEGIAELPQSAEQDLTQIAVVASEEYQRIIRSKKSE